MLLKDVRIVAVGTRPLPAIGAIRDIVYQMTITGFAHALRWHHLRGLARDSSKRRLNGRAIDADSRVRKAGVEDTPNFGECIVRASRQLIVWQTGEIVHIVITRDTRTIAERAGAKEPSQPKVSFEPRLYRGAVFLCCF